MTLKFGRLPSVYDPRTLRFEQYVTPSLPPPPPSVQTLQRFCTDLKIPDPTSMFPMDGNDQYGDCVVAAAAHLVTLMKGLTGTNYVQPASGVIANYFLLTGGPDNGLDMLTTLKYWRRHQLAKDRILAFVAVNPHNHTHVMQAIDVFNAVYIGFNVTEECINQFNANQPWTPGNELNEGHCVDVTGYNSDMLLDILTWGSAKQTGTWAWWDECVDECYVVLGPEAKLPNYAPGFNITQLMQDLVAVTG